MFQEWFVAGVAWGIKAFFSLITVLLGLGFIAAIIGVVGGILSREDEDE